MKPTLSDGCLGIIRSVFLYTLGFFVSIQVQADELYFPVYTDQQPGLIVTVPYGLQHKPDFAVELQTDSQNLDFWSPSIEDVAAAQKALRKTLDKALVDPSGVYTKGGYSDDEVLLLH